MAEIGQDNTCGKYRPAKGTMVVLEAGTEGWDWLGGPRHLLHGRCQGDVKAKDDSRKPEKEVSWSLLPITLHTLTVWSGQDRWPDNTPCRFLLPVREPALPGSHSLSPREAAGILLPVYLNAISKSLVNMLSAAAAPCPSALPLAAGSLGKVLTASQPSWLVEANPIHLGHLHLGSMSSGEGMLLPLDTKDSDRKSKSFSPLLNSGEHWFKKKKMQTLPSLSE